MKHTNGQSGTPKARYRFLVLLLPLFAAFACENHEGIGGTGSIRGTITEHFYDPGYSSVLLEQPAVDEEVFILFGDNEDPGERVRTGPTGAFMFRYLYPGTYRIYFRSDDTTRVPDAGWSEPLTVELGFGQDTDLGTLIKVNSLDFDDGSAVITGTVKKIKYLRDSRWPNLVVEYIDFAHELEVYLTYGDHEGFDERVRTTYDGTFRFPDLIPGKYQVFLYSEDVTEVTEHVVIRHEVTISEWDQVVDLGEITIEEH